MSRRGRIRTLAGGLVATLRRRREDRAVRVRVYDAAGTPRTLDPDDAGERRRARSSAAERFDARAGDRRLGCSIAGPRASRRAAA